VFNNKIKRLLVFTLRGFQGISVSIYVIVHCVILMMLISFMI